MRSRFDDEATQRGHGSAAIASRTPATGFSSRLNRSSIAAPARSPRSDGIGRPSRPSARASTSRNCRPVKMPIASSVVIGRPSAVIRSASAAFASTSESTSTPSQSKISRVMRSARSHARRSLMAAIVRRHFRFGAGGTRRRDGDIGEDVRGPRRQQQHAVGEADRLLRVVRHQQRRRATRLDQRHQLLAQPPRQRLVERDERLVEQQQRRIDREGARQSDAAGEPERQFARIMRAVLAELERVEQRRERRRDRRPARRGARSPRPSARRAAAAPGTPCRAFPQPDARPSPSNSASSPATILSSVVLPQPDGPTSATDLARPDAEGDVAQHVQAFAGRRAIGLARDADLKPPGFASGRHVVQWAAPGGFRSGG